MLGHPLCVECFDYEGAVLWNAHVAQLWSATLRATRRRLASAGGVPQSKLDQVAQVHYLKVAELQRRGLVHLHVLLRADGPEEVGQDPPAWVTSQVFAGAVRAAVRRTEVLGGNGRGVQWGQLLDVQGLGEGHENSARVSSYLAKYVTKTTDGTIGLAHRFRARRQIEWLVDDAHARRLALTAWDLEARPELGPLRLRDHAHTFGFRGQLITKSRRYSTTLGALRRSRADFMAGTSSVDPLEGSFQYDGRGYDDPRGADLAEVLFSMRRELQSEAARSRRTPSGMLARVTGGRDGAASVSGDVSDWAVKPSAGTGDDVT